MYWKLLLSSVSIKMYTFFKYCLFYRLHYCCFFVKQSPFPPPVLITGHSVRSQELTTPCFLAWSHLLVPALTSIVNTHTKPGGRLKWSYAKSLGWQPTLCVAWCLICWFALAYKKYGHTWHRMSLLRPGVIKQHKPTSIVNRPPQTDYLLWSKVQLYTIWNLTPRTYIETHKLYAWRQKSLSIYLKQ